MPDLPLSPALITLAAAASLALLADRPAFGHRRSWRFPAAVIATVTVNLALALDSNLNAAAGASLLGAALLLAYAVHQRLRAIARRQPLQ